MHTPRPRSLWSLCNALIAGAAAFLVAGCEFLEPSPSASSQAAAPAPAMPTMGPIQPAPSPNLSEPQVIATATRLAVAGDTAGALRALQVIRDPIEQARAGTDLIKALAAENPSTAATVALALPAGSAQDAALQTAAHALVKQDLPAALKWAADPARPAAARRAVADQLPRENPRAALDRIKGLPEGPARDDLLSSAAAAWARREPEKAIAWLPTISDAVLRQRVTAAVAFEVAQTNPERAAALAESLPADRNRWLVYSAIGQTWIVKDPRAAMDWVNRLPGGAARESAYAGVQTGLGGNATRQPVATPLPALAVSGTETNTAPWPGMDSPAFTTWLATQPRTLSRDEAIVEFVRQRGTSDPATVGSWVASLPPSTGRREAIDIYFEQVLSSPANAANWLRTLSASDRRDDMIERVARQWLLIDRTSAENWLRTTTLPTFRQDELVRQAGR